MVEYKTRYAIYIKIDMLSFKNKEYFRKKIFIIVRILDFIGNEMATGVGSHPVLQGIFLTQGSNQGLLHFMQILLPSEPPEKHQLQ